MAQFVTLETREGESIPVGQRTLTPKAQALRINWPGGGFVWHRPIGVKVEQAGSSEFHTITDPTRLVLLALWGVTALAMMVAALARFRGYFSR